MDVSFEQQGNRIRVFVGSRTIVFEASGMDVPPLVDATFALWAAIPIAMRAGEDLHVRGRVGPTALAAAAELILTWALWGVPRFRHIRVTAEEVAEPVPAPGRLADLTLFSGGVDAAYALFARGPRTPRAHVLTVHGLDYVPRANRAFTALERKTAPFLDRFGYDRIVVKTDYASAIGDMWMSYAFCLAAAMFLYADRFEQGFVAADSGPALDMLSAGWGTNHVTNPLYRSATFGLNTLAADVERPQKLREMALDGDVLQHVAMCRIKRVQPENCGRCTKCVRSKLSLRAQRIEIPPIFLDMRLDEEVVSTLPYTGRDISGLALLHVTAQQNGTEKELFGFCERFEKARIDFTASWRLQPEGEDPETNRAPTLMERLKLLPGIGPLLRR